VLRGRTPRWAALALALLGTGAAAQEAAQPPTTRQAAQPPTTRQAAQPPARVIVAVLPFEVHSERPLDYLEGSLADLLSTRLEASGRVDVVESVTVRETLIAWPGEKTEDVLRRLARELHADFIVVGSLTELAGRYSLDLRVTSTESRVATATLVESAQGDDELLDRVNELAGRILAIVDRGAEAQRVARIDVSGAPDEAAARAALGSTVGAPFDPAQALADVAALRALPGVANVALETQHGGDGVVIAFRVVTTQRLMPPQAAEGSALRVSDVQVRGNRRIESAAILARVSHKRGQPLVSAQLSEDIRQVYALGFFRDVQVVEATAEDGGLILVFVVEENPVVRQVTLAGNENLDDEKIKDNLTLTTGSTLDYPLLYENRQRIEALYRAEGYYLAKVRSEVEELPSEAVAVHFTVDEGKKLKLRRIEFEGNEKKTDEELAEGLKTKPWHWYSYLTSFLDKSGTYSEPVFLQDLETVNGKYLDDGFVRVDVGQPEVDPEEEGLVVRVEVREGAQYHLGRASLAGDDTADFAAMQEKLALEDGEVFSRKKLNSDLESIESHYTDRGFFMAKVQPLTKVDEDAKQVDVTYEVSKGSLYFLREIDVSGNQTTVDSVVRRELKLVEGQLYSARALDLSKQRLARLGHFEQVNFEPQQTDFGNQLDLGVKVVEKPTGSISFGAGVSSRDGFVVSGSLADSNLFGRGYAASIGADIGGENDRFFINFAWPYFLDSDFGLSTQLSKIDLEYEDFRESQLGAEVVLSHPLDVEGTTRGFLRYAFTEREIEESLEVNAASMIWREIAAGSEVSLPVQDPMDPRFGKAGCPNAFFPDNDSARVPCLKGGGDPGATSLIGLGFRQDTRNDRIAPTSGRILESSLDFAGLGGMATFGRWEGRAAYFFQYPEWFPDWMPFREKSAFLVGGRIGYTLPMNGISDWDLPPGIADYPSIVPDETLPLDQIDTDLELPLAERYFLGGLGTFQLRGFEARSVGPRRASLYPFSTSGTNDEGGTGGTMFIPVGRFSNGECDPNRNGVPPSIDPGDDINGDGVRNGLDDNCNSIQDENIDDFADLDETDVIGGNKFASVTFEYRFPIAESVGLMGIVFYDTGAAFDETQSILDFGEWRQGTGFGVLWFSPFGPLQAFLGFPIDKLSVEESMAFEFSVGGQGF
jgi:outer membrane protein assembly complex protein YaeT